MRRGSARKMAHARVVSEEFSKSDESYSLGRETEANQGKRGVSLLERGAISVACLGIFALFVFSSALEAQPEGISVLEDMLGEKVKVIGEVVSSQSRGEVQVIAVLQPSEVEVVVFGNMSGSRISRGDSIEVIGVVQKEEEKESIIAERIRVVR